MLNLGGMTSLTHTSARAVVPASVPYMPNIMAEDYIMEFLGLPSRAKFGTHTLDKPLLLAIRNPYKMCSVFTEASTLSIICKTIK
jgi:hypothetical protein